jgi:hypothetical protein
MVSIQRRLNSTGRKRIPRERVVIELSPPLDTVSFPTATATIKLADLNLDTSATVVLQAYFRSSSMRFACGTVGELTVPDRMQLTDIDRGGAIQFRLLVATSDGSGRIVASAEGLRPLNITESPDRQPLLRLRETDIEDQLWRVDLDDRNGPWLVINSRVPGLASQLRSSVLVQGLILPHALRVVLNGLPSEGEEEGDDEWGNDWRKFLEQLGLSAEPDDPSDEESRQEWVEEAVATFCSLRRFAELLRRDTQNPDPEHV